jgi:hypothetical protein
MDDETAILLYLGYAGRQTTGYEDEYNADFGFGIALFYLPAHSLRCLYASVGSEAHNLNFPHAAYNCTPDFSRLYQICAVCVAANPPHSSAAQSHLSPLLFAPSG